MKDIRECIDGNFATPMNTLGMGGVEPLITDPVPSKSKKKKRKMKSLKEYILKESVSEVNGFTILKPGFLDHEEEWYKLLQNNGWDIIQKKKFQMNLETANKLYIDKKDEDYYNDLCNYMSSDDCICVLCHKDCGDPIKDLESIKDKVRKNWGKDDMKNAMHSSDSLQHVERERKLIFENKDINESIMDDDPENKKVGHDWSKGDFIQQNVGPLLDDGYFEKNGLDMEILNPYIEWKFFKGKRPSKKDVFTAEKYLYDLINDPDIDIWDDFEPKNLMGDAISDMDEELSNLKVLYNKGIIKESILDDDNLDKKELKRKYQIKGLKFILKPESYIKSIKDHYEALTAKCHVANIGYVICYENGEVIDNEFELDEIYNYIEENNLV